jgi:oligopeptide transport system substrate-binding protein
MNWRMVRGAACLFSTVAALAGCSVQQKPGSSSGASGTAGSPNAAGVDKTLRVVMTIEPSTLDPAKLPDLYTSELLLHSFEGLTRYNDKNAIEPCLAEKWDTSPDGKTYTFHLRSGVKFHNGREFVADDVKYTWERALAPKTASPVASNYLEGVVGLKEVTSGKRPDLTGVKVVDPHTVAVTLDSPRAYFPGMLTYPTNAIVCKEAAEKTGGQINADSFVGTGPFALEKYDPGKQIVLKAFAGYWGGAPKTARIEFPIILNPQTAYDNFQTGKLDIIVDVDNARYSQDHESGKLTGEYQMLDYASFNYVAMQEVKQPIFAKQAVRQAIGMAIDREQILKVAYKGVGAVATGVLPPSLPNGGTIPNGPAFNPKLARQLLAQAGYPDGKGIPDLNLSIIQQQPSTLAAAEIVRSNLKENLGINVSIQQLEAGQFFKEEQKHALEFYLIGWIADYLDPQDFLSTLFKSTSSLNRSDYNNPKFDALCSRADALSNPKQRAALYGEAHQILMNDMPIVPLVFRKRIALVHTNVQGWRTCQCYALPNTTTVKTP